MFDIPGPKQLKVLEALEREQGMTAREIAEATGMPEGSVHGCTSGMVNQNGRHWIKHDGRKVERSYTMYGQTRTGWRYENPDSRHWFLTIRGRGALIRAREQQQKENETMKKDTIPAWVRKRADQLYAETPYDISIGAYHWHSTLCHYIMQHEEEPVDPVLLKARELVADRCKNRAYYVERIRAGEHDNDVSIQRAMVAIRAGIEMAKEIG